MTREWVVDVENIAAWMHSLDPDSYDQLIAAARLLRCHGPHLGRPLVDTVKGSRHKNVKELRPGSSGRSEIRVLFAFDPARQAVMLYAGDKAGKWKGWYDVAIPAANDLFDAHLHKHSPQQRQTRKR